MQKAISQTLNRSKYLLASLLLLGLQVLPLVNIGADNKVNAATTIAPNPKLTQACGLDIALVADNSSSINSTELATMKAAMNSFIDSLSGTPTHFSLTSFSTTATIKHGLSNNYASVKSQINYLSTSVGTNWSDGLLKGQSTLNPDPRTSNPNLIIFLTDGDPTVYNTETGQSSVNTNYDINMPKAIEIANDIKGGDDTRILAIGIGIGGNQSTRRLQEISGNSLNTGSVASSDVITTSSFEDISTQLQQFATETCSRTITVEKVIDLDGDLSTTTDQNLDPKARANWEFEISNNRDLIQTKKTDNNGKTEAVKVDSGTFQVSEIAQNNFKIISAECRDQSGRSLGRLNNLTVTEISIGIDTIASCVFYNQPTTGNLIVKKIVDGGKRSPSEFQFELNEGSPINFSNSELTYELPADSIYQVNEVNIPSDYKQTGIEGCEGTITAGRDTVCTITNSYVPNPTLTLRKLVINDNGGDAKADSWTLRAGRLISEKGVNTSQGGLEALTSRHEAVAGQSYRLSEGSGPNGYLASEWSCDGGTQRGDRITMSQGENVTCTITNDDIAPRIIVQKEVINLWGGTSGRSDFNLFLNINEQEKRQVTSGQTNTLMAGDKISVSEEETIGYKGSFIGNCGTNRPITAVLGGVYYCLIVNTDQPARVTVIKEVKNNYGGIAKPDDFKLKLNNKTVKNNQSYLVPGNYRIEASEENNIPGYTQKSIECVDQTTDTPIALGSNFTTKNGHDYLCIITNEDTPAKINILKTVDTNYESDKDMTFRFFVDGTNESDDVGLIHGQTGTFHNLQSDTYTITEQITDGWYNSYSECKMPNGETLKFTDTVTIQAEMGKTYECEFANTRYNSISGYKFNDADKNGIWSEDEEAIANWSIQISKDNCAIEFIGEIICDSNELIAEIKTDENGLYTSPELTAGKYKVCEVQQPGWEQTFPSEECYTVYLSGGDTLENVNFGNYQTPVEEQGEVLGTNTQVTKPLTNTGASILATITVAIATITLGLTTVRQKQ